MTTDFDRMRAFLDHHLNLLPSKVAMAQRYTMTHGQITELTALIAEQRVLELVDDVARQTESMSMIEAQLLTRLVSDASRMENRDNDPLQIQFVAALASFINRLEAPSIGFFFRPAKGEK